MNLVAWITGAWKTGAWKTGAWKAKSTGIPSRMRTFIVPEDIRVEAVLAENRDQKTTA